MSLKIKDAISPELARMIRACQNRRAVLEAMGLALVSLTKRAFDEPALRPLPWPARKHDSSNPILIQSTLLRRSIRVTRTTSDEVEVGTDRPYAAAHQFGTKPYTIRPKTAKALFWPGAPHPMTAVHHPGLPPRPFFPFDSSGSMTPAAQAKVKTAAMAALASQLQT